jgi:hypothetical protein
VGGACVARDRARMRQISRRSVGCRENRSGVASGRCRNRRLAWMPAALLAGRAPPGAVEPDARAPTMPRHPPRPPSGCRRHRLHGPMDPPNMRLPAMVNVSLSRDPTPGSPPAGSRLDGRNPEGTRDPRESSRLGGRDPPAFPCLSAIRPCAASCRRPTRHSQRNPRAAGILGNRRRTNRYPRRCRTVPAPGGVKVLTGNIRHFPALRYGPIDILKPADFLARHG